MSSNSSNSSTEGGEGNTIPPPNKKQASACKKWTFTLHKYDLTHISSLIDFFDSSNSSYIFSEEKGKSGETPHLQGYCELNNKMRMTALKAGLGEAFNTIHLEKAKGNKEQNITYISKEGGALYKSNDIHVPKPLAVMTADKLRPEQKAIADMFLEDEDPLFGRKVYWFWEGDGCWGKSILCKYFLDQCGAMVVEGANNDILCGVSKWIEEKGEAPRIIIFDIPRVNAGGVSYQAIEKLKNGYFFSGKYESGMVRFNSPHLICFSNEIPEWKNLSVDRWNIFQLNKNAPMERTKYYCKGGPL